MDVRQSIRSPPLFVHVSVSTSQSNRGPAGWIDRKTAARDQRHRQLLLPKVQWPIPSDKHIIMNTSSTNQQFLTPSPLVYTFVSISSSTSYKPTIWSPHQSPLQRNPWTWVPVDASPKPWSGSRVPGSAVEGHEDAWGMLHLESEENSFRILETFMHGETDLRHSICDDAVCPPHLPEMASRFRFFICQSISWVRRSLSQWVDRTLLQVH